MDRPHSAPGGVLAIDHGTKRTGFAVVDALRIAAHAIDPWHGPGSGAALLEHVAALLDERTIATLLVGMPRNMDGSAGARCAEVEQFVAKLRARFPAQSVVTWDERLSTKEALELLREAGHHGAERKARKDSWSALVILRDWIASGEPR